jgi:hypothetical protein
MSEPQASVISQIKYIAQSLPNRPPEEIMKQLASQGITATPAQVSAVLRLLALKAYPRWNTVLVVLREVAALCPAGEGYAAESPWRALTEITQPVVDSAEFSMEDAATRALLETVSESLHPDLDFVSRVIVTIYAMTHGRPGVITSLNLANATDVSDITPIECLTGLTTFSIDQSESLPGALSDLSPLASLHDLRKLNLTCGVSDLSPLTALLNLETLYLIYCDEITDISALGKLKSLQMLCLDGCRGISDVEPLLQCKSLKDLTLASLEGIEDLTPLTDKRFKAKVTVEEMEHAEGWDHWN